MVVALSVVDGTVEFGDDDDDEVEQYCGQNVGFDCRDEQVLELVDGELMKDAFSCDLPNLPKKEIYKENDINQNYV